MKIKDLSHQIFTKLHVCLLFYFKLQIFLQLLLIGFSIINSYLKPLVTDIYQDEPFGIVTNEWGYFVSYFFIYQAYQNTMY